MRGDDMMHVAVVDRDKKERIEKELESVGVFHRQMHPFTSSYLPRALHDEEHIQAAVFGRRKESEGFFGFVEGMLVATDQRVIFLDHRPGYTTMDEIAYDVVSGVNLSTTILYASITLFTKIADYKLSFANHTSAQQFADYIEKRITKHEDRQIPTEKPAYEALITNDALNFLKAHELGVLSTVERTGAISGAVVYYTMLGDYPYFITKEDSKKADNILNNQHVAFTVFDEAQLQTAQLQGIVEQVHSDAHKIEILSAIVHSRNYADGSHTPPILRLGSSGIQTYRIIPTKFNFIDYSKR